MPGSKRPSFNLYQSITDTIVAAIEAGAGPFEMPWNRGDAAYGLPQNALTGSRYRGVNVVALWAASASRGFTTPLWATYRQWGTLDAQVRQGEKASVIVFYKTIEADETKDDKNDCGISARMFARASWVFNADQVEGYSVPEGPAVETVTTAGHVDAFVEWTGADIRHGGDSACYAVKADLIRIPEPAAFLGTSTSTPTEAYYSVLFHELVHWSGAKHRLSRDLQGRFGSDSYAMEELVAELGAAFLCAEFAVSPVPRADHAAYIGHWLAVLKADNRAIFAAASKATQALDYLLARALVDSSAEHSGAADVVTAN